MFHGKKSIKANHNKQTVDKGPVAETHKSLGNGDTCLLMHLKVILVRVLENLVICAILPHTRYVCKYTGHCYKDPMIWEVDGRMGITGVQGTDMFSTINCDYFTYMLILFTVCFVTTVALLVQMLTLDRGHVAISAFQSMKFISSGDNNMQSSRRGNTSAQRGSNHSDDWYTTPSLSVSKRGYFAETIKVIRPSIELVWKRSQHLLSEETGHISTSRIIAVCSQLHALFAICLIIVCFMHAIMGKTSFALMLVFIAIFNSAGCMDIGLPNIEELKEFAAEITM